MRWNSLLANLALAAASSLAHADLLSVTFTGDVYDVNSANGNKTLLASTGLPQVNSMAGNFSTFYVASEGKLYTINRNTGAATFFRQLTFTGSSDIRAMAFDTNGQLWAITQNTGGDQLWKVNISTGAGTLVGSTGLFGIQAMDFNRDDELFAYDIGGSGLGLVRLSRVDGHPTDVNPSVGSTNSFQSILFDNSGNLYATDGALHRILAGGTSQFVGGALGDVRGMDTNVNFLFVAPPVSGQLLLGKITSGGVTSLVDDDQDALVVCRFIVPNSTTPPVQLRFDGESPFSELDTYEIHVWSRMAHAGAFQMEVLARNMVTNVYDSLGFANLNTTMSKVTFTAQNPVNYGDANGQVSMVYRVKAVGPSAVLTWCHEAERLFWRLEPFIR